MITDLTYSLRRFIERGTSVGNHRVAIVAVHGAGPTSIGSFGDRIALGLQAYLNASEAAAQSPYSWEATLYEPDRLPAVQISRQPRPIRLYRNDEPDPLSPHRAVYDIYEAYWAPIARIKNKFPPVLGWLFKCSFAPRNPMAMLLASPGKLAFDISYVLSALVLAGLLLATGLAFGQLALERYASILSGTTESTLAAVKIFHDPITFISELPIPEATLLVFGTVTAVLLTEGVVLMRGGAQNLRQARALLQDIGYRDRAWNTLIGAHHFRMFSMAVFYAVLFLIVAFQGFLIYRLGADRAFNVVVSIVPLVFAWACVRLARSTVDFIVRHILGDLYSYTSAEGDSEQLGVFGKVNMTVAAHLEAALSMVTVGEGSTEPLYDKVHLLGQGLGATIALEAAMHVDRSVAAGNLLGADWNRLRSLTTVGGAMEKCRYFADAQRDVIFPAARDRENRAYGRVFTSDRATLIGDGNQRGVYWSNHWYFRDVIANSVVSYLDPGDAATRTICENYQVPHRRTPLAFVSNDYIADPLVWANIGRILTS